MPPTSVAQYGFHLEIFFKSKNPELTPIAGLLVATKGQAAVERRAVEIDAPGADAVGDSASAVGIPRLHKSSQSEWRVVGDLDRLVLGVIAHDGQHGAKNLLSCNLHLRRHIAEDGRADIVSTVDFGWPPRSANPQRPPFVDAGLDEILHFLKLHLAHQWPHSGRRIERVAQANGVDSLTCSRER